MENYVALLMPISIEMQSIKKTMPNCMVCKCVRMCNQFAVKILCLSKSVLDSDFNEPMPE